MRCKNFILWSKFEKFECLLRSLTFKHIQIFYNKLVFLGPSNSKASSIFIKSIVCFSQLGKSTYTCWIKEVKHFFIVNLQEWAEYAYMFGCLVLFHVLYLIKEISYTFLSNSFFKLLIFHLWIISIIIKFSFISLHCKCLSTTCLPISKDGSMIPLYNFANETWNSQTFVDIILLMMLVEYLIKVV